MLLYRSAAAMVFLCHFLSATTAQTQPDSLKKALPTATTPTSAPSSNKWYDKLSLRGYAQLRYNRMLESNPDLRCEQCDKAIGKNQGIAFRRARLQLSGDSLSLRLGSTDAEFNDQISARIGELEHGLSDAGLEVNQIFIAPLAVSARPRIGARQLINERV